MLTCQTLKQFSMEKPPEIMLGRSPEVQTAYETFSKEKKGRGSFVDTMKKNLEGKEYHFVKNDFPYQTVPGIEHWVCWYMDDKDPEKIIDELKSKVNVITCWKNLAQNCSILEISHIHVFIDTDPN